MVCKSHTLKTLPVSAIDCLNSDHNSFFCSFSWYENFVDTVLKQDKNWSDHFIVYEQNNVVHTVLPLKVLKTSKRVKQYESLGNYYSPLFQFNRQSEKTDICGFFVSFKQIQKNWGTIVLKGMDKQEVFKLSKKLGLPSIPFFCFANWYLDVNQRSFDEYFIGLSSKVKNTVFRKTKQFNKIDGSRTEIFHKENEIETAIQAFESVYALSWKSEETFPDFISGLIRMASKQGALRLGIAYINDIAIAAQLWIVADNTAYIYKLAYDEKHKKLSTGTILTATLMRYAIDVDKVKCVDYLSGDDAYKKEWMSHRRERWGVMIFNPRTLRGCLKMINEFTRFYFKKCLTFK